MLYINGKNDTSAEQNESAQVWTFTQTNDGWYYIQNAAGQALTVENGSADDGADILLADFTGDTTQKFRVVQEGESTYALLTAASGGKGCADVYNISLDAGANICQWEYWGGDGQKYLIEPAEAAAEIAGDVNADGVFDVADAVTLQRYLLTIDSALANPQAADFNADGRLNAVDLTLLKRALLA